jgi:hypothetical protein
MMTSLASLSLAKRLCHKIKTMSSRHLALLAALASENIQGSVRLWRPTAADTMLM